MGRLRIESRRPSTTAVPNPEWRTINRMTGEFAECNAITDPAKASARLETLATEKCDRYRAHAGEQENYFAGWQFRVIADA